MIKFHWQFEKLYHFKWFIGNKGALSSGFFYTLVGWTAGYCWSSHSLLKLFIQILYLDIYKRIRTDNFSIADQTFCVKINEMFQWIQCNVSSVMPAILCHPFGLHMDSWHHYSMVIFIASSARLLKTNGNNSEYYSICSLFNAIKTQERLKWINTP